MRSLIILTIISLTICDNASSIKSYLTSHGFTRAGAAGLMGNLYAESGLNPAVYEYAHQRRIGLSQEEYVRKTNDGSYKNFVSDAVGFGLAQWTYWSRKQALYNACKGRIADLNCQLGYLVSELRNDFRGVYRTLTSSSDVNSCCDKVLLEFERPANAHGQINKRRGYCRNYY